MKNVTNQLILMVNEDSLKFCSKTFKTAGSKVVNSYLCEQGTFNTADLWNVQMQKKPFPKAKMISLFN